MPRAARSLGCAKRGLRAAWSFQSLGFSRPLSTHETYVESVFEIAANHSWKRHSGSSVKPSRSKTICDPQRIHDTTAVLSANHRLER